MSSSPFAASSSEAGRGAIDLVLLPPANPVLQTLSYQYPLKLIAPSPIVAARSPEEDDDGASQQQRSGKGTEPQGQTPGLQKHQEGERTVTVHTVFILTYGGGLVAGDSISLSVYLAPSTRLVLLTQGSTKIFKTPDHQRLISTQHLTVDVHDHAGLVYLPDPVQPFELSAVEQTQVYVLHGKAAGICFCDWVCEGRAARGEKWRFWRYVSRNEVWGVSSSQHDQSRERQVGNAGSTQQRRLLLRDNVSLSGADASTGYADRTDGLGVFGTLILHGPLFQKLAKHFADEFMLLPRIGARQWDDDDDDDAGGSGSRPQQLGKEERRAARHRQEAKDGVLWTVSRVRDFTLVKFGAREVEGVKKWLRAVLVEEGSVPRMFGERALLCLK